MSMGKFHFTKSTIQANCWCNRCMRETPWKIFDGRRQFCMICHEKPSNQVAKREVAEQINLFGGAT